MVPKRKFTQRLRDAWEGVAYVIRSEPNMPIHLTVAGFVLLAGLVFRVGSVRMAILTLTVAFVFVAELINTAIEHVVDMHTYQYHPLAKHAKDVAAGAVLVASIAAVAVGLFVFIF